MANWSKVAITDLGRNLIAQSQTQGLPINITYCKTSSHNYYNDNLAQLTDLDDIEQSVMVSERELIDNTNIKLTGNFDNNSLTTGYQLYTYGIYANLNGGSDILFLVGATDAPDSVPPVSSGRWQALINSYIQVANANNITITVDYNAYATQQYVQDYVQQKLDSRIKITLPADDGTNYTTMQDKDGVDFYKIRFTVAGMTATYNGTQPLTPTMVDPEDTDFSIAEWEEIRDTYFPMIMSCFGRAGGYVDVYLYDLPDKDFDVYLYGV